MKLIPTLKNYGFGSSFQLPKENISGTVPAWVRVAVPSALFGLGMYLGYRQSCKKSEAKVKIAEEKRKTAETEQNTKMFVKQLDIYSKLFGEMIKQGFASSRGKSTASHFENSKEDESSDVMDEGYDDEDLPEWEDAGSIQDRKVDSALLGHCGGIILVKGVEGQGKSTLTLQMMIEACEGKNSKIRPSDFGITGSQWEWAAYLYASESSPKFHSNFGKKLEEIRSHTLFMARVNDSRLRNIERVLRDIRKTVLKSDKNCIIAIDNVTDMFPDITGRQVKRFKNELESIRDEAQKRGRMVTFIIVAHANAQTSDAADSKLWQKFSEVNISILEDKKRENPDCKIISIDKNRFGACGKYHVCRLMTPYMHFECYDVTQDDASSSEVEPQAKPEKTGDNRIPVTPEVEDLFASIYKKGEYGYGSIYNDYKDRYQLKSDQSVRNAIVRAQKRKAAA